MGIITSLVKSVELFLTLKNKLAYYEIKEKSRIRQKQIIEDIEKLRDAGDSNSADRADILRKELSSERQSIKHLPAFDPYAEG
jgi:hypothetical protein